DNVRAYFDEVAAYLADNSDKVLLTGHTDDEGSDEYNTELGMERAMAFKRSLVKRGVAEDRIIVESKGRSMPIASNDTEEGRQLNRRVELRLTAE
ncbi:MAG: OmpA family protein, partial [Schleiferiaceae bacterium]|nr:OmpA family protein [Schleiferiaceae bacterium]